ncbi:MAG: ATP-binding cassette domain-containing protein [Verrucomicrobiales bacterium]|nr:ATP-binding cassette domain-containing protein [Verrucomicrobiales bacterium]
MIRLENVLFRYPHDSFSLDIGELEIPAKQHAAVIGPSGCGKTTLLRLIAGILPIEQGSIAVQTLLVHEMPLAERQRFRIQNIGLVFQEFELLDYLTVGENILLPYRVSDALTLDQAAENRAAQLAETAGISPLFDRYPAEMSQGERQRVSICRALVTNPNIILADEPTGNLDPENQQKAVDLLKTQASETEATLVMVTHEHELLSNFERVVDLADL